ncbi:MAG: ACP S-malonyltransferase [Eubacteriales bacterium]
MEIGFLYAGQGSQCLGMGKDLYDRYPSFAKTLEEVDPTKKYRNFMFGEDLELLSQTENTQPCMVAFAVAMTALLQEKGIKPRLCAGLSLGEYSALACSKVFSPLTAVETVAFRGNAMAEAAKGLDCAMVAVLGLSIEKLKEACEAASSLGVVEIANYNCPNQLVMGGEAKAVALAGEKAKELGAKRCLPLKVSGPFHTSLMKPAGDALREKFQSLDFGAMTVPVVFNATAKPLGSGETIPSLLEKQVQSSVYFEDSIRYMLAEGIDTFIEIGPGKVLSGFVKKIDSSVGILSVENVETLENTLKMLEQ